MVADKLASFACLLTQATFSFLNVLLRSYCRFNHSMTFVPFSLNIYIYITIFV